MNNSNGINQIELQGKLYDLIPAKKPRKKAQYSKEGLIAREKNYEIPKLIISRAQFLFYEKGLNIQMKWKDCVRLASQQLKQEGLI